MKTNTIAAGAVVCVAIMTGATIGHAADTTHMDIGDATILSDSSEFERMYVPTGTDIPTDGSAGAFGYGVITTAGLEAIIVTTTHAGVKDSIAQTDADDASFHNHYVALHELPNDTKCPGLEVRDISFQEPGDVAIRGDTAILEDTPYYFMGTHSLSGDTISFQADHTLDGVVSFTINPVDRLGNTSVTDIHAVCINDVKQASSVIDGIKSNPAFVRYK